MTASDPRDSRVPRPSTAPAGAAAADVPEAVLELLTFAAHARAPLAVSIHGDRTGAVRDALERAGLHVGALEAIDVAVWIAGAMVDAEARGELLRIARVPTDGIVLAAPLQHGDAPSGRGVALPWLRRLDPELVLVRAPRTRERGPRWAVASVAAWRLRPGAEFARARFLRDLPWMDAPEVLHTIAALRTVWPGAFELYALAAAERRAQGDVIAARAILSHGARSGAAPRWLRHAALAVDRLVADDRQRWTAPQVLLPRFPAAALEPSDPVAPGASPHEQQVARLGRAAVVSLEQARRARQTGEGERTAAPRGRAPRRRAG